MKNEKSLNIWKSQWKVWLKEIELAPQEEDDDSDHDSDHLLDDEEEEEEHIKIIWIHLSQIP